MAMLDIALLGGFQARIAPDTVLRLPPKAQALLAYLALRPGKSQPRDKVAALLWGDAGQEQARTSLRQTIATLRRALVSVPALIADGRDLALSREAISVDAASFEQCVAEATPDALERAIDLYGGDLLEGLEVNEVAFEEWLVSERERFREAAIAALAKLLACQEQAGATEKAIRTSLRLLALDSLQEPVHRTLMQLYVRQGRRGAALKQYQVCVGMLQRELGTEPEAPTKQLYQQILRQRPGEAGSASASRSKGPHRQTSAPELEGTATPLIGREIELGSLRAHLRQAMEGQGHVVAIVGEAGVGKSALVTLFAVEAAPRARVLIGRSYESEQVLAFGPWISALRAAGLTTDLTVLDKIEIGVRVELARLLPELGPYDRQPGAAGEEQLRLFASLFRVIAEYAHDLPLLIVLEDVHWADEMSLRYLAFLGRRIHDHEILVLVTARGEEFSPILQQTMDELTVDLRFATLALGPLSRAETAMLVAALVRVGTDDRTIAHLSDQVWPLSEGNPFVVVEALRALGEGTIAATSATPTLSVPERVRRMVCTRLARLSEPARELAALAAIIGRAFEFRLLQRAGGMSERETAESVDELVRRRILHGVEEGIDFTHDRIRDTAYRDVLPSRRMTLHAAVAESLEELGADNLDEHYTALARHYGEAEIWPKAATYLQHAGTQALLRSAYRNAVASFERALDALRHLPERPDTLSLAIDIRLGLWEALGPIGHFAETLAPLEEAREAAERLGDVRRRARVVIFLTHILELTGDLENALARGEQALAAAREFADVSMRVTAHQYVGRALQSRGDYRRACDAFVESINAIDSEHVHDHFGTPMAPAVEARSMLTISLSELGRFDEAQQYAEQAMRIAADGGRPLNRIGAATGSGFLDLQRGEFASAIETLEGALALAREWSIRAFSHRILATLISACIHGGRRERAVALLADVMECEHTSSLSDLPSRLARLAEACLVIGRSFEARELAARALDLARRRGGQGSEAWSLYVLGRIAAESCEVERARAWYEQALERAAALAMRPLLAHCHAGLGATLAQAGQSLPARAQLSASLAMYASLDMRSWLVTTERALASLPS